MSIVILSAAKNLNRRKRCYSYVVTVHRFQTNPMSQPPRLCLINQPYDLIPNLLKNSKFLLIYPSTHLPIPLMPSSVPNAFP